MRNKFRNIKLVPRYLKYFNSIYMLSNFDETIIPQYSPIGARGGRRRRRKTRNNKKSKTRSKNTRTRRRYR